MGAGKPWHLTQRHPSAPIGDWISDPARACNGLDTEAWFPERGASNTDIARVKRICSHCPVLTECREFAVNAEPLVYGIWGGTTESQRTRLRRERRAA